MRNIFKYRPVFYLKRGHFGQHGWGRVSFFKWLRACAEYVNKVEWEARN